MSTTPHRGFFIVVDKNHYNIIVYIYFITPVRKQFTTKSLDKVDRRAARLPNIHHPITLGKRELSFSICTLNVNKTNIEAFIIILFLLMPILLRLEYMCICCLGERHNRYLRIHILDTYTTTLKHYAITYFIIHHIIHITIIIYIAQDSISTV